MGINLGLYASYAAGAFLLASGLLLKLPRPILSVIDFFYIGFPPGILGILFLVVRVSIGILFVLHGWPKITHLQTWAKDMNMPIFLCFLSALSMFAGGFFLIAGLLTPLVALAILGSMLFAMILEMSKGSPFVAKDPFQIPSGQYEGPNGKGDPPSWEKAFLYVVILSAIAIIGPGAYSLDALLLT
ncbi:MAG: DoxX family protein [Phormidesmis sp.]